MTSRAGVVIILTFILLAVVLSTVAIVGNISFPLDGPGVLHLAGRFMGVFAYIVIAMQYVWTAKVKIIENLLPYDQRVAVHRTFGFLGITAVSLHPVLVLAAFASWGTGLQLSLPVALGFLSLLLLLLVGSSTFLSRIWGVRYEVWKHIHWVTFGVLVLAFSHSMMIGSDIDGLFRGFWIGLFVLHALIVLSKFVHKIVSRSRQYRVASVAVEAPGVRSIHFEKPGRHHHPGQFAFISLRTRGSWSHWHPFSITSTRDDDTLGVAVKEAGDFTRSVGEVKPGDAARVDPGYGGFSPVFVPDSRYVMIAGGIGIAPIYGILRHLRTLESPPEVILIYTAHHESDLTFREDIDAWFEEIPNWSRSYVITSQPDWEGERGRLTPERVIDLCDNSLAGTFFLCGPSPMVRSIRRHLRARGVPGAKIRRELFEFLP